ncbi:hypothetical protein [Dermacoccus nishinomiyaensis]|uniref:hypothetical protein n=1 Tax=Dermacoccus nishinomiyaensis TaxID=1274 RepID=UPI00248E4722|nr:hypothetical protein [Dermacoccus nishinomiyaensis]
MERVEQRDRAVLELDTEQGSRIPEAAELLKEAVLGDEHAVLGGLGVLHQGVRYRAAEIGPAARGTVGP